MTVDRSVFFCSGIGVSCRNRTIAFVSTFAAFFTRAFDNLRMGVISQTNINVMGSHCGVSIGEDGPSQMALEDLAMFQSLPGCTVFYPSDAVAMERSVELAANTRGICYLRATRPALPVLYSAEETFRVGEAKLVRQSETDQVLVVAAGVTLYEALSAADTLAEQVSKYWLSSLLTIVLAGNQGPCLGSFHHQTSGLGGGAEEQRGLWRSSGDGGGSLS